MSALSFLASSLLIRFKTRVRMLNKSGSCISNNVKIRNGFFIDQPSRLQIGEGTFINYFCHMHCGEFGHITIGEKVFIGPDVKLCCVTHEIGTEYQRAGKAASGDIVIKNGVWIGIGAIILPGVTIGSGSIIAAGSVVNKDVKSNVMVAGVPAREIKRL